MEVTKWPARVNQAFRAKGREIHPDKHPPAKRAEMMAKFQSLIRFRV